MGLGLLLSAICIGYPLIFMPSYISESAPFPTPLTKAEETRLLSILQQKNTQDKHGSKIQEDHHADTDIKSAKEKLISHNMRLVAHVAKKYSNTGMDQEDLISIGSIGLIKAIDTYSSSRSTRLGTYAARCIENAIHPYPVFV